MHFFDTVETIPDGMGFSHFDATHACWLVAAVVVIAALCVCYCKADSRTKAILRKAVAVLIVLDELFKWVMLFVGGNAAPKYLPLHLCSINIFLIAFHAFKPTKTVTAFLYLICIPSALIALAIPTWVELPPTSFMHIHSFTVHILLAAYPMMLTASGEVKLNPRRVLSCVGLLAAMAIPAAVANLLFDTNFMFLHYPEPGTPFVWFAAHLGSHLFGFLILLPPVILLMVGVWALIEKFPQRTHRQKTTA